MVRKEVIKRFIAKFRLFSLMFSPKNQLPLKNGERTGVKNKA